MLSAFFVNKQPPWRIAGLFSWQHFLLVVVVVAYVVALSMLLRKRSEKTQKIVLITIGAVSVFIFFLRWFLGPTNIFEVWEHGFHDREAFLLLPLELCNIGAFMILFAAIFRQRWMFIYVVYLNIVGSVLAFTILPNEYLVSGGGHMGMWMFWDFVILHANIIAVPVAFISIGWYHPRMRDMLWAIGMLFITSMIVMGLNFALEALGFGGRTRPNYMDVMYPERWLLFGFFYKWIPIPLVWMMVSLLPIFFVYFLLLSYSLSKVPVAQVPKGNPRSRQRKRTKRE